MDALAIVRGLAAGVAATFPMTAVEALASARWGRAAVFEWTEAGAAARRLMLRQSGGAAIALHFLGGGLAGIVFVLGLGLLAAAPTVALGAAFGFLMWAVTLIIHEPITGEAARGLGVPLSLLGHLVFGTVLGLLAALGNP